MYEAIFSAMFCLPVTGASGMFAVDGVGGKGRGQVIGSHVGGPRRAEPAHHVDRTLHLAPPLVELRRTAVSCCVRPILPQLVPTGIPETLSGWFRDYAAF